MLSATSATNLAPLPNIEFFDIFRSNSNGGPGPKVGIYGVD